MKIKNAVGIGLGVLIYVALSIYVFGAFQSNPRYFPFIFFLFSLAYLEAVILIAGWRSKRMVILMVSGLFICISVSYFASALMSYSVLSTEDTAAMDQEIQTMTEKNNYYMEYITVFEDKIAQTEASIVDLQAAVDAAELALTDITIAQKQPAVQTVIQPPVMDDALEDDLYEEREDDD